MRIGIDARFFGSASKGLGRYTEQLVRNLETINTDHEFYIFMRTQDWDSWTPENPRFQKVKADINWYSLEEQTKLPSVLRQASCDLIHYPHFNVPLFSSHPFVATVHDLILSHFPTVKATTLGPLLYWFKHQMYQKVMKHALQKSSRVLTVSNFTKADIEKTFHIPENKVVVTYEGVDSRILETASKGEINIPGEFILYVGNAYPHKNLERLIDAFGRIQRTRQDLYLVLVGKHDFFYKRLIVYVREQKITHVLFPGFVSDMGLGQLYAQAQAFVFPSLYEGFGLPPLEAMARRVPVVCSNSSCLPEIAGDAALYFSPEHLDDMIHAIERVLSDSELRQRLVINGLAQYKKYSWRDMAEKTLRIYETAV